MTRLYFAGAEQPSHRNLLADMGVTRFAINLTNMNRSVKGKGWKVAEHLPQGAEWIAYCDPQTTWDMAEPYVKQEPLFTLAPLAWADRLTDTTAFGPFYEDGLTPGAYPIIGLNDVHVKHQSTLRTILANYSDSMLVAVTGSSRGVDRLDALVTSAWVAAQRFGETQVWSGTRFHRYAGSRKAESRPKHRADIERLGIDYALIEADDPEETARLAVVSWLAWEANQPGNVVSLSSNERYSDQDGMGSAHRPLAIAAPLARHDRDRVTLPIMGLETMTERHVDGDGAETFTETQAVRSNSKTMLACDTCFLATKCPMHLTGASCAYEIPVEIRTKDQLQALMRVVIEMQGQRVFFLRFAEEIQGQGLDGMLSQEIDRLFKSLAAAKDINDTRDVLRLEMEARGNAGMLSRLFGAGVGTTARQLSAPLASTQVLDAFEGGPPNGHH